MKQTKLTCSSTSFNSNMLRQRRRKPWGIDINVCTYIEEHLRLDKENGVISCIAIASGMWCVFGDEVYARHIFSS